MHFLLAQNLITASDGGTFEASGSDQQFISFGANCQRSAEVAYQGTYSLKMATTEYGWLSEIKIPITNNSASTLFTKGKTYMFRCRVYIPSQVSTIGMSVPGLPSSENYNNEYIWGLTGHTEPSAILNCGSRKVDLEFNKWATLYLFFYVAEDATGSIELSATGNPSKSSSKPGIFYIDNLELIQYPEIIDNATISGGNITLNPSGGVPVKDEGSFNYKYLWSDGVTYKDRVDLTGKVSVNIYSKSEYYNVGCNKKEFTYYVSPCVENSKICSGEQSRQLIASCAPIGATYEWYDSKEGWNLIDTDNTLQVGPFSTPGLYKYYVLFNNNGVRSLRTEVTVEVAGPTPAFVVNTSVYKGKPLIITAQLHQPDYRYAYNFDDGVIENVSVNSVSHIYKEQGNYTITCIVTDANNCTASYNWSVYVKNFQPLCETIIPAKTTSYGEVNLDKFSGRYVLQRKQNCSVDIPLGCIQGQVDAPQLRNVVSASVTTFSDSWRYDYMSSPPTGNAMEKGEVGKWRPQATYAYNKGNVLVDKNYNSGTFQLSHFNWQYPEVTKKSGWMKVNEVTKYTPNGEAVEEKNSLDILSTAKFGYSGALPYLIAQNASYNSVLFEGFENLYSSTFEDGVPLGGNTQVSTTSHSGGKSLLLGSQFTSHVFTLTKQLQDKGLLVRAWVNGTDALSNLKLKLSTQSAVKDFSLVARSGVWSLVEARIDPGSFGVAMDGTFTVSLMKQGGGNLWIDDVRMQPADAEVSCYVYDVKTLRVLTVFDDQHFGLFYQYDAEGKLVRKQIETARGIKTVQETQYNIPEKNKADFIGE